MRLAAGRPISGDRHWEEGADPDLFPGSSRLVEGCVDDLQGPRDPVRVGADAETDPVGLAGGNGDGPGAATDHLDGHRIEREARRPLEPARDTAEGDVPPVQVGTQDPQIALELYDALGALTDGGDSRVAARHSTKSPAAAQYLYRQNPRGDDPGIPGDEVEGSAQQFDPRRRIDGVAHLAQAVRHPRVVLAEHLEVKTELL